MAKRMDSSRTMVFLIIIAALGFMLSIMLIPKEPPKGLTEESGRHALPKELVEAALKRSDEKPPDEPELPPAEGEGAEDETEATEGETAEGEEAPTAPTVEYGRISINSTPTVDVYVGEHHIGRTPVSQKLPTGLHRLRFTDKEKLINLYKRYRIHPGSEQTDNLTIGQSELIVHAPSDAKIFLNGRSIGRAPIDPQKIYEGRYLLKVTHDGKTWTEWFNAPPGRKIEYKVRMQQD